MAGQLNKMHTNISTNLQGVSRKLCNLISLVALCRLHAVRFLDWKQKSNCREGPCTEIHLKTQAKHCEVRIVSFLFPILGLKLIHYCEDQRCKGRVFLFDCVMQPYRLIHEELSKFATCQKRKVKTFQNPAIFWQPAQTYCGNMMISGKKIPPNLATLDNYFQKCPMYELHWIIFCQQVEKNCKREKSLVKSYF